VIKINLCPLDELESQYWYLPDLAVAAVCLLASFLGVQYYLGTIQEEIDKVTESKVSLEDSYQKLAPDLERFKDLDADIAALNSKLQALRSITVSKISKYKPVIVTEHLQNLKPEGAWYTEIKVGIDGKDGFELKGQAFDSLLIAELLGAIRSTELQEVDESDLRTQVYFTDIQLDAVAVPKAAPKVFREMKPFPEFSIKGRFSERGPGAASTLPAAPIGLEKPPVAAANGTKWKRKS
jgi:hypothetical protein